MYRVADKTFAVITLNLEPAAIILKLPPDFGAELRSVFPRTVTPGYHMNKTHWNTIYLVGKPAQDELIELIDTAYELVRDSLPRQVRDSLPTAGQ